MENQQQITEINRRIREGLNQWANICLMADADQWSFYLNYFPADIMNVMHLFQHVCSNIGIKAGLIDEKNAEEYGQRLRQLIKDMTGYDTVSIAEAKEVEP